MIIILAVIGVVATIILVCLLAFWLYDGVRKAYELELALTKSGLIYQTSLRQTIMPISLLDTEEIESLVIRIKDLERAIERIENEKTNRDSQTSAACVKGDKT